MARMGRGAPAKSASAFLAPKEFLRGGLDGGNAIRLKWRAAAGATGVRPLNGGSPRSVAASTAGRRGGRRDQSSGLTATTHVTASRSTSLRCGVRSRRRRQWDVVNVADGAEGASFIMARLSGGKRSRSQPTLAA